MSGRGTDSITPTASQVFRLRCMPGFPRNLSGSKRRPEGPELGIALGWFHGPAVPGCPSAAAGQHLRNKEIGFHQHGATTETFRALPDTRLIRARLEATCPKQAVQHRLVGESTWIYTYVTQHRPRP